jgi:protein-S-isoprenylcysteine O-methyltransferase Ste14
MSNEAIGSRAAVLQAMRSLAGFLVFIGVARFLPAGRWGWTRGWLFLAAFFALTIPSLVYLRRTNPEIFVARSRIHGSTKTWDKVILSLLLPSMLFEIVLAALDSGRFHWSRVPAWATALGYVFLVFGYLLSVWAYRFNKFAEPGVRVQKERGQQVIDGGPYALVRHPVYLGGLFIAACIPLTLGSLWALIPAAVGGATILVRILMEERTLRDELDGYREYMDRVRWRLVPRVW